MSTQIPVKLNAFDGPLDLLLHLIEINKINIYDIPISEITDQYLAYIDHMGQENMDVTSEFLVMASTLLDIKSRMLLPHKEDEGEGEEEDPRDELVRRLVEYRIYKMAAETLKDYGAQASRNVYRKRNLPPEIASYREPIDYAELIGDTTAEKLNAILGDVLKRFRDRRDPVRGGFGTIVREEISVEKRQLYIRACLKEHRHTSFRNLLQKEESREGVIVTFLVILEMIKDGEIRVSQDEAFGEITIDAVADEAELSDETEFSENINLEDEDLQWKTDRSARRWKPYCLPWVMPWKSALWQPRLAVHRKKYWKLRKRWRHGMRERGAASG